jgi:hypothetical protein
MQFTFPAAAELDLAFEKQIEPTRESTFHLARTFRDRLQLSMLLRQPRDDKARFGKLGFSKQDGGCGVQERLSAS